MSEEVLDAACELAFAHGSSAGFCFFGGEPLLKKDLIYRALDICLEKSHVTGIPFKCKMTTNGTLLDEEFLARAKEVRMGIGLSFDGKAQDICRRFANKERSPSSEVLVKKAKLLLQYIPDAMAMATIAPQAVPYYFESVKYIHDLGFRKASFVIAYGEKVHWTDEDLDLLSEQIDKTGEYVRGLFEKGEDFYFSPLDAKIAQCIKDINPADRCHLGTRQMPVTPDGKLYPCTSFIGDEEYLLGDVFTGLDMEAQKRIAMKARTPETCLQCDLLKRCTNSCGCANRMNTGDENKVSPLQCAYERMIIEQADKIGEAMYTFDQDRFVKKYSKI